MTLLLLLRPHASAPVLTRYPRLVFDARLATFDDPAPLARPRRQS